MAWSWGFLFFVATSAYADPTCGVVLGEYLMAGRDGRVYAAGGDSAVKMYQKPNGEWHDRARVALNAERLKLASKLFGENCIEFRGLVEPEPGHFGILMSRIPDRLRTYDGKFASERTITDLQKIQRVLNENKLFLVDFQFTLDETGRVIVFDLDELSSWDPTSPLYRRVPAGVDEAYGRKNNERYDTWIRYAREDINARATGKAR